MKLPEISSVALRFRKISARHFRNLDELDFFPAPRFNVIFGDNGEGKTNLLELIDYLTTLKSFRDAKAVDMVGDQHERSVVVGEVVDDSDTRTHLVNIPRKGARQYTLNGKRPRSRYQYLKSAHTVVFHPASLKLVTGPPLSRREHMDAILEKIDPTYGSTAAAYQRALRSRNRLLSEPHPNTMAISAYDELLASAGAIIGQSRAEIVRAMGPRIQEAFQEFSGEKGTLTVRYKPRVEPELSCLREALEQSLPTDLQRGFTAEGPHADELELRFKATSAKHHASQGQQRAMVLALKIAELLELEKRAGRVPILLLDDVSSELDRSTNRRLFSFLGLIGGQVFLSTTHPEFILLNEDRSDFSIKQGRLDQSL